jgi:hypothetical protein
MVSGRIGGANHGPRNFGWLAGDEPVATTTETCSLIDLLHLHYRRGYRGRPGRTVALPVPVPGAGSGSSRGLIALDVVTSRRSIDD